MQNPFRHLFGKDADTAHPAALQQWADAGGHAYRRVRDAGGCVIEGQTGVRPWRIEWGESQRSYITSCELRLTAELGLSHVLMAMVLTRVLMAEMEREVYEQYVNDVQTRIDTNTPPEMRWLVMYAKLDGSALGLLKNRFGAVGSAPPWVLQWLSGSLRDALLGAAGAVRPDHPMAMMISRGRLTLRTAMPMPDAGKLALWFSLFEVALRSACAVGEELQPLTPGLSTQPGGWGSSEFPRTQAQNTER